MMPIEINPQLVINNKIITLEIYCNDMCNYNCVYCANLKNNAIRTNKYLSFDSIINFIEKLKTQSYNKIQIELLGGEPTLHPQFNNFMQFYKNDTVVSINVFSNFSAPVELYINTISKNIKYSLSYHYLNDDRERKFLQKINYIKTYNVNILDNIEIIVMLVPGYVTQCINTYNNIIQNYSYNAILLLIDDFNRSDLLNNRLKIYSAYELDMYNNICQQSKINKDICVKFDDGNYYYYDQYMVRNNVNFSFKRWKCTAGKTLLNIDVNGNIYPCINLRNKLLGNINNKIIININTNGYLCQSIECCSFDFVNIQKIFK